MQGAPPPAPPALAGGQAGNRYALAGCAGRLHGTTARKGDAGFAGCKWPATLATLAAPLYRFPSAAPPGYGKADR